MARKQIVQFIDDIDGSVLDDFVTVRWALGDKQYEFDTSPEHADEFYESLEKYVAVSRRADSVRQSRNSSRTTQPSRDVSVIREWARANGYEVNARGRLPAQIIEAFDAAN
ncbi:histone-like nucleoid-structuring protein Lsr2 [Gordonia rubripertincta]|uniref:Lsr2 family protein n=1 Tax=Gordonia rubripertincta TaxID=36822 RepID=A0ABT4MWW1_GORRU|nr:Lsr2 family protein [Gordonia rubripertincta]MCZ4551170.1 Lsr2 family protein [Gordonia rubripertincta]